MPNILQGIHILTPITTHTPTYTPILIHTHLPTNTYTYITHTSICIHIYIHLHLYLYTYTYTYTYTPIPTYTPIHLPIYGEHHNEPVANHAERVLSPYVQLTLERSDHIAGDSDKIPAVGPG